MKKLPLVAIVAGVILLLILVYVVWQKTQTSVNPVPAQQSMVKKVDLSTQPQWVQLLKVTAKKGKSANGLDNVTLTVDGMPDSMVSTISYIIQYETTNKGTQGALSTTPLVINGKTSFTKKIDLGTCSTQSCVRHEGVTSVDIELDFTMTSGETPTWTGTIPL